MRELTAIPVRFLPMPSPKLPSDVSLRKVVRRVIQRTQALGADAPANEAANAEPGAPAAESTASIPLVKQMPVRTYARLVRQVLGHDAIEHMDQAAFDPGQTREVLAAINQDRISGLFTRLIATGVPLDMAQAEAVREFSKTAANRHLARAFVLGMQQLPDGDVMRAVGMGQILHSMAEFDRAWAYFEGVDRVKLARLVPLEAVTSALFVRTPEGTEAALEITRLCKDEEPSTLLGIAGRLVATGHIDVARDIVEPLRGRADLEDADSARLRNLVQWTHPTATEPGPEGAVTIGVIDYHQPELERASANVGDYVQTLAMLGNLARFQQTRFTGPDGLGELTQQLQGRVRPDLHIEGGKADVHLLPISRDFSSGDAIPEQTWMVAFGWHMHSTFRLGFGLPYHPHLNPLFVSFHVNRVNILTPEAIDYLKAHGPIGCRDWTTVYLLLSAGVDAFFTGCLTTTVNAVFKDLAEIERDEPGVVGIIDLSAGSVKGVKKPKEFVTHAGGEFREAGLVEGTKAAISLLEDYQHRFSRVVTSRLHSYLPATSLGLKVRFRPRIVGDVRFDGLYGMAPDAPEFVAMRDGIRHLLATMLEKILAKTDRDQVYAAWRELTEPLVAQARARFEAPSSVVRPHLDVGGAVVEIRSSSRAYGPHDDVDAAVTDVTMSLDANFKHLLPVTVESLVTNASGPLRLWITTRGLDEDYQRWFAGSFPDLPITFLPYDHVDYGEITRMIRHITVATMDRLLLPEVLDDLDRVTYVDIDTVTTGDVCELAATDLRGFPLAARTGRQGAAEQWRSSGNLLDADKSADLRRMMSQLHPFDFMMFNAGVLVLDLARMRADKFAEEYLPFAGSYGFNDQDILNAYAGAGRAPLDGKWNALPVIEEIVEPGIVHYAGAGKPWEADLVPYGGLWRDYAARFRARVGEAPQ
jgi:lipopolysaccharide biosynthesis glycosyltransferase